MTMVVSFKFILDHRQDPVGSKHNQPSVTRILLAWTAQATSHEFSSFTEASTQRLRENWIPCWKITSKRLLWEQGLLITLLSVTRWIHVLLLLNILIFELYILFLVRRCNLCCFNPYRVTWDLKELSASLAPLDQWWVLHKEDVGNLQLAKYIRL